MKAEKLFHRRRAIGASQEELAKELSKITGRVVHTETVRNIEQLVIGVDELTYALITEALQKLGEPVDEEVMAA